MKAELEVCVAATQPLWTPGSSLITVAERPHFHTTKPWSFYCSALNELISFDIRLFWKFLPVKLSHKLEYSKVNFSFCIEFENSIVLKLLCKCKLDT